MKYASEHGRRGRVRAYYAAIALPYLLLKLKLIRSEAALRPVIAQLAPLMTAWDEHEGAAAFDWIANEFLLPTQRPEVVARLRGHQEQGHVVAIVSAMFTPCTDRIARHFAVGLAVGTNVEVSGGRYTGRILPPVITGADKERCIRDAFAAGGLEIDWAASYAYADSITDQGLLGLAGHPVAVYPDPALQELAAARGWERIGMRR